MSKLKVIITMVLKKNLHVFYYFFLFVFLVINRSPLEIAAQQCTLFCISTDFKTPVAEIIVPDNYPTIQEAINNANEGDIIYVRNGTYYENVIVNKTVSLIGDNKFDTTIDGGGSGKVIFITADNVTVTERARRA